MLVFKVYMGNALYAQAIRENCSQFCGQCVSCLQQRLQENGNTQQVTVEKRRA